MEFEQVRFKTYDSEAELGGIAVYKYGKPLGIICGCCGSWHSAKRVCVLEHYENWLNIGAYINEMQDAIADAEEWEDEDENEE